VTFAFAELESYWTNDYRGWEWSGVEFHLCNRLFVTHDFIVPSGCYKVYCFCRSQSGSLNDAMVELKWKTLFGVPFDQVVNPRNISLLCLGNLSADSRSGDCC
jgi:hypothetical protein